MRVLEVDDLQVMDVQQRPRHAEPGPSGPEHARGAARRTRAPLGVRSAFRRTRARRASSLNGLQRLRSFRRIGRRAERQRERLESEAPRVGAARQQAGRGLPRPCVVRPRRVTVRHGDVVAARAGDRAPVEWNQRAAVSPNRSGAAGKTKMARTARASVATRPGATGAGRGSRVQAISAARWVAEWWRGGARGP